MKKHLLIFLLLISAFSVYAETQIEAGNVSGNWELADSPFYINGHITILDGTIFPSHHQLLKTILTINYKEEL